MNGAVRLVNVLFLSFLYLAIGPGDVNGPPRERVLYQGDKPANAGEAEFDH